MKRKVVVSCIIFAIIMVLCFTSCTNTTSNSDLPFESNETSEASYRKLKKLITIHNNGKTINMKIDNNNKYFQQYMYDVIEVFRYEYLSSDEPSKKIENFDFSDYPKEIFEEYPEQADNNFECQHNFIRYVSEKSSDPNIYMIPEFILTNQKNSNDIILMIKNVNTNEWEAYSFPEYIKWFEAMLKFADYSKDVTSNEQLKYFDNKANYDKNIFAIAFQIHNKDFYHSDINYKNDVSFGNKEIYFYFYMNLLMKIAENEGISPNTVNHKDVDLIYTSNEIRSTKDPVYIGNANGEYSWYRVYQNITSEFGDCIFYLDNNDLVVAYQHHNEEEIWDCYTYKDFGDWFLKKLELPNSVLY